MIVPLTEFSDFNKGCIMNELKILRNAIDNKHVTDIGWYTAMFALPVKSNDYVTIKDDVKTIKDDETTYAIDEQILSFETRITIDKGFIPIIDKKIETTIGNFIINYLLSVHALKGRVPFINKRFTIKKYHTSYVLPLLKDKKISIQEYHDFANVTNFLSLFTEYVVWHITDRSIQPPPGLEKFKKDLLKEYEKQYGKEWKEDVIHLHLFVQDLKAYYNEYLKDDPAFNKFIKGKVLESRRKRFLAIGVEKKMSDDDDVSSTLTESLMDGLPMDRDKIAVYFNGLRAGSYSRGVETQSGGVITKTMLRAATGLVFDIEDCGTTRGSKILVTEHNIESLKNLYIIKNGKTVDSDNIRVGDNVYARTPQYCQAEGEHFCKKCGGKLLGNNRNGLPLLLGGSGGKILNFSMKSIHSNSTSLVTLNVHDLLG
jgi:hypothetical protein